jgi:hypothetical protein
MEETEEKNHLSHINHSNELYINYGSRSSKSVDYYHNYIKDEVSKIFCESKFSINLEYNVPTINAAGRKKCDIVVLKDNIPYIIFPVKMPKSNYKQNKNNSFETLTGELQHLKWKNPDIKIIPINIFMNKTPYLKENKKISKFETITIEDIKIYNYLTSKNITYDMINYIIIVEHNNIIGEQFDKIPNIIGFDSNTPFRSLFDILKELL